MILNYLTFGFLDDLEPERNSMKEDLPTIKVEIESDYDNYFTILVASWIRRKIISKQPFHHKTVVISAGPYRSYAVDATESADKERIKLDFYSALRAGFGSLPESEVVKIIELL